MLILWLISSFIDEIKLNELELNKQNWQKSLKYKITDISKQIILIYHKFIYIEVVVAILKHGMCASSMNLNSNIIRYTVLSCEIQYTNCSVISLWEYVRISTRNLLKVHDVTVYNTILYVLFYKNTSNDVNECALLK